MNTSMDNFEWTGTGTAEAQRLLIYNKLDGAIVLADETWAAELYPASALPLNASKEDINAFLEASDIYDTNEGRWTELAAPGSALVTDAMLCEQLKKIFDVVFTHWGRRETRTTRHCDSELNLFMITGSDTVFAVRIPGKPRRARYRSGSAVAIVDVTRESAMGSVSDQIGRIGINSRRVFNAQPNRHFVRSLVVSERSVRVFHFDRSGVKYSPAIDIYERPHDFITLVLGITSEDPTTLGFDPSIVWETDGVTDGSDNLLHVEGKLSTLRGLDRVEYNIIGHRPSFQCFDLCGRGTTCWNVTTKDGKEDLLVKDSWRSEGWEAEHFYLTKARGLKGVGQMVGFQDLITTASLRGRDAITEVGFTDCTKTRMTLERYGPPIYKFNTVLEVLHAFHDAILGHFNLVGARILHRDVSINNILIGKKGAPEGWRGVLIDLDMAILLNRTLPNADVRTGTRMFQSRNVLKSCGALGKKGLQQNHLDDLESFFYCFCYLIFGFINRGVMANPCPRTLEEWNREDPRDAYNSKVTFWTDLQDNEEDDTSPEEISPFWGPRCKQLLFALANHLRPFVRLRDRNVDPNSALGLYEGMVALFKSAIDDIIASQTTPTRKTVPDMATPRRLAQMGSPLAQPSPPSPDHTVSPSSAAPSSPSMIPSPSKPVSSSRHLTTYESQPTHWAKTRSLPPPPQPQFAATLKRPSDDGSSLFSDRPVAAKKIKSADGSAIPSPPRAPPG